MGSAKDLDLAKTEFKAAWEALKARTSPEQLAAAYKAMNIRDDDCSHSGKSGGCQAGGCSHSVMCDPVFAARAFRSMASRRVAKRKQLAFSRNRLASSASRCSRDIVWLKRYAQSLCILGLARRQLNVQPRVLWFLFPVSL